MASNNIGQQYDEMASWWNERHLNSEYGAAQFERALSYIGEIDTALDVGCGSGGRFIQKLEARGCKVTGVDASAEMIKLARQNHPQSRFIHGLIEDWDSAETFDFILAWDSLFHLPLTAQKPVLSKLCERLNDGGILIHSFGDAIGEHTDSWRGQEFRYSSIGISENIRTMMKHGLSILHLERDQFPESHVYSIAIKAVR